MDRISNLRQHENVLTFTFQPGNGTRFDITVSKLPDQKYSLFYIEQQNKGMFIKIGNHYNLGYLDEKLGYGNDSDLTELQTLIQHDLKEFNIR